MCLAVRKGNLPCVQALIDAGFDADMGVKLPPTELEQFRSSQDAVPILTCVDKVNLELVRYLLSRGASPLYRNLPIAEPLERCPLYNAFLKSNTLLEVLLMHCADMKSCPTLGDISFPITELGIWEQSPSCFELVMQAGFRLDLDSMTFDDIRLHRRTVKEVAKIWWTYTDEIPKNEHLIEILGTLPGKKKENICCKSCSSFILYENKLECDFYGLLKVVVVCPLVPSSVLLSVCPFVCTSFRPAFLLS